MSSANSWAIRSCITPYSDARKMNRLYKQSNIASSNIYSKYTMTTKNARDYPLIAFLQDIGISGNEKAMEKSRIKFEISQFSKLAANWNDNGAEPIPTEVLLKALELIDYLPIIPDAFPTACGTVQLEYEKETGEYLEFELQSDSVKVFRIDKNNNESTEEISYNYSAIGKMVRSFEGR